MENRKKHTHGSEVVIMRKYSLEKSWDKCRSVSRRWSGSIRWSSPSEILRKSNVAGDDQEVFNEAVQVKFWEVERSRRWWSRSIHCSNQSEILSWTLQAIRKYSLEQSKWNPEKVERCRRWSGRIHSSSPSGIVKGDDQGEYTGAVQVKSWKAMIKREFTGAVQVKSWKAMIKYSLEQSKWIPMMEEEKEKVAMNIVFIYACYLRLFTYRLLTPRLLTTTTIIWIAPMIVGDSLVRYHDHLDCSNDRWWLPHTVPRSFGLLQWSLVPPSSPTRRPHSFWYR